MPAAPRRSQVPDPSLAPSDMATAHFCSAGQPDTDLPLATRIGYFGDYEIIREIARGGMGVVFQARQVSLNRPVALKMILAGQLADETDVKRFHAEAEAAANLDHPGIVPDLRGRPARGAALFLDGIRRGAKPLPAPGRRATAGPRGRRTASEGRRGDGIRPPAGRDSSRLEAGNILLDRSGNPRVTDFGLAKKLQTDSALTGSGQIMGTPSYMPPEQAAGNAAKVGPAADVYAMGATLYALVTGRPPFQAATAIDTVLQVLSDEPVPPRRLNPSIPGDLETICLKCLEKEPASRYSSASTLAEELGRYLSGEPIRARAVGPLERARKWARRRPAAAGLVAVSTIGVVALSLTGFFWSMQLRRFNTNLRRRVSVGETRARRGRHGTPAAPRNKSSVPCVKRQPPADRSTPST